ncbi:MAG: hypothetical protein ABIR11_01410, partial [Candidatus Limnocylindrales bacterium]
MDVLVALATRLVQPWRAVDTTPVSIAWVPRVVPAVTGTRMNLHLAQAMMVSRKRTSSSASRTGSTR